LVPEDEVEERLAPVGVGRGGEQVAEVEGGRRLAEFWLVGRIFAGTYSEKNPKALSTL
jgi:hypothetical protein